MSLQQQQQQSKITAFFTARNKVVNGGELSTPVTDAAFKGWQADKKLQRPPSAELPKDIEDLNDDGTSQQINADKQKKRRRKRKQLTDKCSLPPLKLKLASPRKTRSATQNNDINLTVEKHFQSEIPVTPSFSLDSANQLAETTAVPKKRGRKRRKLHVDAISFSGIQLSDLQQRQPEVSKVNNENDGRGVFDLETGKGCKFTASKEEEENEMNVENLLASTTTTKIASDNIASLQIQYSNSGDNLKQFSSLLSSPRPQSEQWPSLATFHGTLNYQETGELACVTSTSVTIIQSPKSTLRQHQVNIETGGKLLQLSSTNSFATRLRTKLAAAVQISAGQTVSSAETSTATAKNVLKGLQKEDALNKVQNGDDGKNDDSDTTEIDELEIPLTALKTRQSRCERNLRKRSTRLAIYTATSRAAAARRISFKSEHVNVSDDKQQRGPKRKTSRKISTTTTTTKTNSRKQKSSAKPVKQQQPIPVITLDSSDSDKQSPSCVTKANPALPPPTYLKLWTSTYEPKSTDELIGQKEAVESAKRWLVDWQTTFAPSTLPTHQIKSTSECASTFTTGKCLLLCGPSGVGKTALVYALARESSYQVLEYSATSQRLTPALVQKEMNESLQSHYIVTNHKDVINESSLLSTANLKGMNIFQRAKTGERRGDSSSRRMQLSKSLILIDDFEGIFYEDYANGGGGGRMDNEARRIRDKKAAELWRTLQAAIILARKPIIITCSFQNGSSLFGSGASGQHLLTTVQLYPVNWQSHLRGHLSSLISKELNEEKKNGSSYYDGGGDQQTFEAIAKVSEISALQLSDFHLDILVHKTGGDVRQAVNQLQFWMAGKTELVTKTLVNFEQFPPPKLKTIEMNPENEINNSEKVDTPLTTTTITATVSDYLAYLDLCSVEDVYKRSLDSRRWSVLQDIDNYDVHLFEDRRLDFGELHRLQSSRSMLHGCKSSKTGAPLFQNLFRNNNLENFEVDEMRLQQNDKSQYTADVVALFNSVNGNLNKGHWSLVESRASKTTMENDFSADKLSPSPPSPPTSPAQTRRSERLRAAKK